MFDIPHLPLAAGATCSFVVCLLIVLTSHWHGHLSLDDAHGVQKFHAEPTPRIGGVAILMGGLVGWLFAPPKVDVVLEVMWLAGLPAFVFGFAEDLTRRVGVRERLLATMASGVLAWWLTDVSLTRLDIWGVDRLLAWTPFSVAFTAFAVGGITNAFNIIDGFNGLAAGVMLVCLSAFGLTAFLAGDPVMAKVCFVMGGVTFGFLMLNFPWGKIFLGDGGAYLLGFWVAWIAVLIPMRNPEVSPWSSLLICAYPIVEVLVSILRRRTRRQRTSPGAPDRLHLHSLVKSRITKKHLYDWAPYVRNSAVSPPLWLLAAVPAAAAPWLRNNAWALGLTLGLFLLLYLYCYRALIRFAIPSDSGGFRAG